MRNYLALLEHYGVSTVVMNLLKVIYSISSVQGQWLFFVRPWDVMQLKMQLDISLYEETAIQFFNLQNSLIGKCSEGKAVWK